LGLLEAAPRQPLSRHVPGAIHESKRLGPLDRHAKLELSIGLPLRNQDELEAFNAAVSDPASPRFRQYMEAAVFAERFGPLAEDYEKLIAFVEANGLTVTARHSNRMVLGVSGPVAAVEKTLHIRLSAFEHATRGRFMAPESDPWLDTDVEVLDISGLDNFVLPKPMNVTAQPLAASTPYVTGSGPGSLFIGKDFRAAYAPGVTLTGAGQSIGLIELDGFYSADVAANFKAAGLPVVPVQTVLLDGFSGAPGSANIEVILDIMMAAYMAPGSSIIVYEGKNWNNLLNRMATDNTAKQLSCSWAFSPINATTEQIFKQYIAQGQSFLQASGDSGAYKGSIMPPSDNPNVTVVGGTSLTTSGPGGAWLSEKAWSGSGGGASTAYPLPSYQAGLNMTALGGSATMRNIPDVALTADIQMYLIQSNGKAVSVGGTSAAAPLWAGFIALANQQAATAKKSPVGFLNPAIYTIGKGAKFTTDLHDITVGSTGLNAGTGFDLATGWGSPTGQKLIDDLTSQTPTPSFTLTPSAASVPLKTAAAATVTIQLAAQNGFTGTPTLSVSGLPAGVTGSFGAFSSAGASTLTFTATAAAVPGTYTASIQGTSGTISASTSVSVVLTSSALFTLTSSLASVSVAAGGSNSAAVITIVSAPAFTGKVTLGATGLPTGVTAVFGVVRAGGLSTLTISASTAAALKTTSILVTGTSGTVTASIPIAVTVTAPADFSVKLSPASLTIVQGTKGSTAISITPLNGFNGNLTLTSSGAPAGVVSSFSTATGALLATLTAGTGAAVGSSKVTFTLTSGALSHAVVLNLAIVAPAAATAHVDLSAYYNVAASAVDGVPFTNGGLDALGRSYSGALLGASQSAGGVLYALGPMGVPDAVSGQTVALPQGKFTAARILATAVNGNQGSQTFTVKYTDGTSTAFTQSLSDWYAPQNYPGETTAVSTGYRNNSTGTQDGRVFNAYGYSLKLNTAKTVASITLPANRNVVVLAVTLTGKVN